MIKLTYSHFLKVEAAIVDEEDNLHNSVLVLTESPHLLHDNLVNLGHLYNNKQLLTNMDQGCFFFFSKQTMSFVN